MDLPWTFSQTPTEHVFPVPNVSHNVALRVSVQSLPRQSNYPVLTCSIHTNLSFYEKRMQERRFRQHGDPSAAQQCSTSSPQRFRGKQTRTMTPEGLLNGKKLPEFTTSFRNLKLYPSTGLGSDFGASQSKVQCYKAAADNKTQPHETPVRTFKSYSLVDSRVSNSHFSHQPTETNPLIGSLLQERQEVIARIAQHLIHCDPATSPVVAGRPFNTHENISATPKAFRSTFEDENLPRKSKESTPVSVANSDNAVQEDGGEGKTRAVPEVTLLDARVPGSHCGRQSGESNPLIDSLLQERQEVIARIAQHLIHCDPATSHVAGRPFKVHEASPVTSKIFRSTYEDENLLKKGKEPSSVSFAKPNFSLLEDSSKSGTKTPDTPISPSRLGGELKTSLKVQARRKLVLAKPSEAVQNAFHQTSNKTSHAFSSIHTSSSCIKGNKSEVPDKLEIHSGCAQKDQITNRIKQGSNSSSIDEQICTNKLKERTVVSENNGTDSFNNLQIEKCRILEGTKKATVMPVSDSLHKNELKCLDKDSKKPNIYEQNTQLVSIENYLNKEHDSFKNKTKQDKTKTAHDENEDPTGLDFQSTSQKKPAEDNVVKCERQKNADVQVNTYGNRLSLLQLPFVR